MTRDAPNIWVWGYGQMCSVCDRPTESEDGPCPKHQPEAYARAQEADR